MKRSHPFWLVVEGMIWFGTIYLFFYFIQNPVNYFWAALTITLCLFAITLTSPVMRNMRQINKILDRILEEEAKKYDI
ncbi:MAG: hypothetical protein WCO10_00815 [bacterium]